MNSLPDTFTETIPIAADRNEWKVTYDEQWFLVPPQTAGHVLPIALSITGVLDVEKLDQSFRQLLLKHRALRSVYRRDSAGNFVRTLKDVPEVVLQHIRCEKDKVFEEIKGRNTPFNLAEGPLYRFFLFEIATEQYILYCCLFHSILDGPGAQVLFNELADRYSERMAESSEREPDFLDFAEWRESNPRYDSDQEFYHQMFADGFKINPMPWKVPLQEAMPCDGVLRSQFEVSPLENGARLHRVFLFSAIIGALGLALGKYCQCNDVALCLVMNARITNAALKKSVKKMIGLLADRFPIRLQWEKDQSLSSFLKATHERFIEILHHQSCSGRKWMKESAIGFDPDLTPIVSVNYRHDVSVPLFHGLQVEPLPIPPLGPPPKVQSMAGILHQTAANLNVSLMYSTHYFDTDSAEGMNENFSCIIRKIADGTDIALAEL